MATIWVHPSDRWKGAWSVGKVGFPVETRKSKRGALSWAHGMAQPGDVIKIRDERGGLEEIHKNPPGSFEARATRAIRKGEKFLVSLPARLRGKRRKR